MDELASIVIPTRSSALLTRCLESLRETTEGVRYEVVVVRHLNDEAEDARVEAVGGGASRAYRELCGTVQLLEDVQ